MLNDGTCGATPWSKLQKRACRHVGVLSEKLQKESPLLAGRNVNILRSKSR